jgi:hypothetical protein
VPPELLQWEVFFGAVVPFAAIGIGTAIGLLLLIRESGPVSRIDSWRKGVKSLRSELEEADQ